MFLSTVSFVVLKLGHASKTIFFSFSVKLNIIAPFNKKAIQSAVPKSKHLYLF